VHQKGCIDQLINVQRWISSDHWSPNILQQSNDNCDICLFSMRLICCMLFHNSLQSICMHITTLQCNYIAHYFNARNTKLWCTNAQSCTVQSSTLWGVGESGDFGEICEVRQGEASSDFKSTTSVSFSIFYLGYTESLSLSFSPPPGWQDLLKKEEILTQQQSKSKTSQHEGINS